MSNVEKYCEECGTVNSVNAKFCQVCGEKFYETSKPFTEQPLVQPPQYHPRDDYLPPNQHPSPQQGFQPLMMSAPAQWQRGGLLQGIISLYKSPTKSTAPLLEDQSSPTTLGLVFVMAALTGLLSYINEMKTEYLNIDVTAGFESRYEPSGIQQTAIQNGVFAFAGVFLGWWVGSWVLGLLIKGGLPYDSVVRYNVSQSMRKLNGYRYVPSILVHVIQILLLQGEQDRKANVSMEPVLGVKAPVNTYVSDYSDFYLSTSLFLTLAATIVSAFILYKAIKHGLRHTGIAPAIIAVILVLYPIILLA
jgi:hypothetical protein